VHRQHALASEDVLGLLCQQVAHEHVEAVLVKRPPRNNADAANAAQVVQLLPATLRPPVALHTQKTQAQQHSSKTQAVQDG
jgi:hypothetical protein